LLIIPQEKKLFDLSQEIQLFSYAMQYTLSGAAVGMDFLNDDQRDTFSNSSIEPF
jgi:hypothetical protein